MSELGDLFDLICRSGKSPEHCSDVGTILHGDDSELIFLIDPHKEGLLVVVEDASSLWPVSIQATSIKESVSFLEKEMVRDQLVPLSICHRSKGVESSSELSVE